MDIQIKPLEWEDADEGMCTKWRAAALGGHYELVALDGDDGGLAVNFHWGKPLSFWFIQGEPDEFGPTGPKMFPALEVAKAAAQADYERRILAALAEPAGEAEPCQFLPTEDGEFNGNTFGNGDDVPFGWITQRAYDHAYTTSDPVQVTILRTESGPGLMPRVPLYTTPPDASAIREALDGADEVEIVARLLWERFSSSHVQTWEEETHRSEYRIAAADCLSIIKRSKDARHEAAAFLYKHGDLTHSAAHKAIDLLVSNGFAISTASLAGSAE